MELGKKQTLTIIRRVDFGVYLSDSPESAKKGDEVLLPIKQLPEGAKIGDEITVFLYKDSKDRLIATVNTPLLEVGQVARLTVRETGRIGAFLDWGLEKDLLLPFKEQTYAPKAGESVLVAMYVDKTGRLCATMKLYPYLEKGGSFRKDDQVQGLIYELSNNFGAFVAVEDRYSALIPKKEMTGTLRPGDIVTARVTAVKPDGKIDLAVRAKAYEMIGEDADKLVSLMQDRGGEFSFTDKADPERIRQETDMSKNEFKRAIGHLLKAKRVEILADKIRLK